MLERPWLRICACLVLAVACSDEPDSSDGDGPAQCVGGQYCPAGLECIDGFCLEGSADDLTDDETGDGDGDPSTGDGDGDPSTGDGDGDGDPTTGDGDGDGDPTGDGDGDGDGDPTTGDGDGDGDGDPGPTCGNGIVDLGEQCDGDNLNGFSCQDIGYSGGMLGCDPVMCWYTTDGCIPF